MRRTYSVHHSLHWVLLALAIGISSGCSTKLLGLNALEATPTPPEPTDTTLQLSAFRDIVGTPYRVASVTEQSKGVSSLSFSSHSGGSVRNCVFFDTQSLRSQRLFSTNRNLILDSDQLSYVKNEPNATETSTKPAVKVKWLILSVVDHDTNRDGALNADDHFAVAFTDAFGDGYFNAIPEAERLLGTTMVAEDEAVVTYIADGNARACRIDLRSKTVTATVPLTPIAATAQATTND